MPTGPHQLDPAVLRYYDTEYDESTRLTCTFKGRLEAARVRELFASYLAQVPGRPCVADVGGGAGAHSLWLLGHGCTVAMADPVPRHVEYARSTGIDAVVADARVLPWESASFDAMLCAGPLYHLIDPDDRKTTLSEAVRVLRPGGFIAVVAMSRFSNLLGSTIAGTLLERGHIVEEILNTGTYCGVNDRFVSAYYHTPVELREELLSAGFTRITMHALTGPGAWLNIVINRYFNEQPPEMIDQPLETALYAARLADRYPELLHASGHLFAVGFKEGKL